MLKLETCKQIVLAQRHVHLVGNDGILRLRQVPVCEDVARKSPGGIMILTIVHHDLHHGSSIVVFRRTRLVLERIGATQGVVHLSELGVQLGCDRGELIFCIVTAGERTHAVVGVATVCVLITTIDGCSLVTTDRTGSRSGTRTLAVRLGETDVELMVVVDVPV